MKFFDHFNRLNELLAQCFIVKGTKRSSRWRSFGNWHFICSYFLNCRFLTVASIFLVKHILRFVCLRKWMSWSRLNWSLSIWILSRNITQKLNVIICVGQLLLKSCNFILQFIHLSHLRILIFLWNIRNETGLSSIIQSRNIFFYVIITWR